MNAFPKMPVMTSIIRPDRCEKCRHAFPNPLQSGTFECRRMPPTVTVFKFQTQNANVVEFKEYTTYPKLKPEQYCGEYRPHIDGVS